MDSFLQPITETEEHPFCAEVMKRLDVQRKNELFCDVILEVGSGDDQSCLKAHKNVLSSAGPFFFNALNSEMKEKKEGVIRLKDTSKAVMEKVLDYLYTGRVEIHEEIAYELFTQADYFLLPNLKALSSKFIVKTLDISNCIMAYHFAVKYKDDELQKGAREFILENFLAVAGTEDFLNLSFEEIEEFISSDKVVVEEEEDVFRVIVKWIGNSDKEQDFFLLLRHVRCIYLSPSFVSDVILQHPLVNSNTVCEKFISDVMNKSTDASLPIRDCLKTHDVIIASEEKETLCYLPTEGKWYQLATKLSTHQHYHYGISSLNNKLYIIGACWEQGGHIAECFDPSCNQWISIRPPEIVHYRVAAVSLQGFLYAIGGRTRNETVLNIVQRYNPDTNRWQEVSPLSSPRSNVCAVADGNYLYAIGGMSANFQYLDIVERYDPVNNTWNELPSMITKRAFASGAVIGQKIFVFGGLQPSFHVIGDPCEMYDPDTNLWSGISSVAAPRNDASAVNFKGEIYVNGVVVNERERHVNKLQVYDVEKNEWKSCQDNPLLFGWHEITTLTIPDHVLAKCKEISKDVVSARRLQRMLLLQAGF